MTRRQAGPGDRNPWPGMGLEFCEGVYHPRHQGFNRQNVAIRYMGHSRTKGSHLWEVIEWGTCQKTTVQTMKTDQAEQTVIPRQTVKGDFLLHPLRDQLKDMVREYYTNRRGRS